VRDGDVAPVPEPATMFFFGSGLIGLLRFSGRSLGNKADCERVELLVSDILMKHGI